MHTQGKWSKVPEGKSFDVFPHISLLTLDVMLRCTCSYQSNCQTNKYVWKQIKYYSLDSDSASEHFGSGDCYTKCHVY